MDGTSVSAGELGDHGTDTTALGSTPGERHYFALMQCFLPRERPPDGQREYLRQLAGATLLVRRGLVIKPDDFGDWRECVVPFGATARLIVAYINAYALLRWTRTVDLGTSSLARLGLAVGVASRGDLAEQVEAVATAPITLGLWRSGRAATQFRSVAGRISYRLGNELAGKAKWEPSLTLSRDYMSTLIEHPVPVDLAHLIALASEPRRMDVYYWLAYRTSRIPFGQQVRVKLAHLHSLLGTEVESERLFRRELMGDLEAIRAVYSGFRVRWEPDALVLERGTPPNLALP